MASLAARSIFISCDPICQSGAEGFPIVLEPCSENPALCPYHDMFSHAVSSLTLKSLIHFEFVFLQGKRHGLVSFKSTFGNPVVPAPFTKEAASYICIFDSFGNKTEVVIAVWAHFCIFSSTGKCVSLCRRPIMALQYDLDLDIIPSVALVFFC